MKTTTETSTTSTTPAAVAKPARTKLAKAATSEPKVKPTPSVKPAKPAVVKAAKPSKDRPVAGKVYNLTSATEPSILSGNTWEESEAKEPAETVVGVDLAAPGTESFTPKDDEGGSQASSDANPADSQVTTSESLSESSTLTSGSPSSSDVASSTADPVSSVPDENAPADVAPVTDAPKPLCERKAKAEPKVKEPKPAKEPKAPKVSEEEMTRIRDLVLSGMSPSEVSKETGCYRGLSRTVLQQEVAKLGATYVPFMRIVNGEAVVPTPGVKKERTPRTWLTPSAVAIAPVRFALRDTDDSMIQVYDMTTDSIVGTFSVANRIGAEEVAREADRYAAMTTARLKVLMQTYGGTADKLSIMIAEKVLKITAAEKLAVTVAEGGPIDGSKPVIV